MKRFNNIMCRPYIKIRTDISEQNLIYNHLHGLENRHDYKPRGINTIRYTLIPSHSPFNLLLSISKY